MTSTTDSIPEAEKAQQVDKKPPTIRSPISLVGDKEIAYNPEETQAFIDTVFHAPLLPGARRLVYTSSYNNPGMPSEGGVDNLINKTMTRTTKARAMYFCASSCVPDEHGVVRHLRDLFSQFHVLVLDDIGTKIPLESLPKALRDNPTYIIESSEGNCQYGYVLDTPIDNYEHAVGLVQAAALAGYTDGGGLMATKIVRLPAGINGKRDEAKRFYPVTLKTMDGPYWTPDVLLKHINLELNDELVTWERIVAGEVAPLVKKYRTNYLPLKPVSQAANGAIDPVLEWLYRENMVLADSGGAWVAIQCPWAHSHTTGDNSAGYSPIGRGDLYTRGFNCFHEHCANNKTKELISYVLHNSDFTAIPVRDPSAGVFEKYCLNEAHDKVWRLGGSEPTAVVMSGFKNKNNQTVHAWTHGAKGVKLRAMSVAQLWLESPYRLDVDDVIHSPGDPQFIRDERADRLLLNTYRGPLWGDGAFDESHAEKFLAYVEYLLPIDNEREYFLDWLTAKIQDPTFRGTGIIMATSAYGVGRSTLGNMIGDLVGRHNAADVSFDDLLGATDYNFWETSQFVLVSEARESADYMTSKGPHKAYETLKQRIDSTNTMTTVNIKYQPQRAVKVCTSYLILTQHADAVAVPKDDRRLTVMSNPEQPAPPAYFTELNAWLQEKDKDGSLTWAKNVYRWLRARKLVNAERLNLPLTDNVSKEEMIEESRGLPESVAHLVAKYAHEKELHAIGAIQLRDIVTVCVQKIDMDAPILTRARLKHVLSDVVIKYAPVAKIDGKTDKLRLFKRTITTLPLPLGVLSTSKSNEAKEALVLLRAEARTLSESTDEIIAYVLDKYVG